MKGTWKKRCVLLCTLLLTILLFPVGTATAHAEGEGKRELEESVRELMDALDTEDLQAYLDSLAEMGGVSVKERLISLLSGDLSLDYGSLGKAVLSLVWEEARSMLPAFALILAIALLCGLLNSMKTGLLQGTMSDIIYFVGFVSAGAVTLSCLIPVLQEGFAAVGNMRTQMELVYPLLLTLMAGSGGTVSVGIYRPAVAFMSGLVCELFSSVVLPVGVAVIVLAFVGNLSSEVRTEKLAELFKSILKWVIGLTLGLFSLFLSVQGFAAAQYDGISLRAAKYVVSGSVPIVGGFLSGGLELVVAGSSLIKNALGAFAVFMLFGAILKPVALFVALQLFLRLSAAATEPIGGKISEFLSRLAKDTGYFLAAILCVAFLYLLTLVLIVCSAGVAFV